MHRENEDYSTFKVAINWFNFWFAFMSREHQSCDNRHGEWMELLKMKTTMILHWTMFVSCKDTLGQAVKNRNEYSTVISCCVKSVRDDIWVWQISNMSAFLEKCMNSKSVKKMYTTFSELGKTHLASCLPTKSTKAATSLTSLRTVTECFFF